MSNFIVTINRECGSGGGTIARLVAERLGVKVYGRAMLDAVAGQFGLSVEEAERVKARRVGWWSDFCRFYQQYGAAACSADASPEATPLSLYYAEARLLRDLAERESCVVIGRAGFYVFRDVPGALHVLVMADREARVARIAGKQGLGWDEAARVVEEVDRSRDVFVRSVAGTSRYDARNYDLALDVTGADYGRIADFLADDVRHRFGTVSR